MMIIEIFIFGVIEKQGSPCVPYLGFIRMLWSPCGCDDKSKVNQRQQQGAVSVL